MPDRLSRTRGCLLGGAIGDALGAPVEFLGLEEIRQRFGPAGITDFAPAYGRHGAITDDTQMTMFTAEGILRARCRWEHRGIAHGPSVVWNAYRRWLLTQNLGMQGREPDRDGWLIGLQALHHRRTPGRTCVSALQADVPGTLDQPLNNSMGCGGVMRAAPAGLAALSDSYARSCELAALTHGHPGGWVPAGCLAVIVAELVRGTELDASVDKGIAAAHADPRGGDTALALEHAVTLAREGVPGAEKVESLGGGFVGPQAIAIAVYAALAAEGDFARGVILAVNHSGDSDSTGAIAGNILGASSGLEALPKDWRSGVELGDEILALANDLVTDFQPDEAWWNRYPGH